MYAHNTLVDAQFVDARNVGAIIDVLAGDYTTETAMDVELATANAAYYTAARLATMSINDKIFALRNAVDGAGFLPSGVNTGDPAFFSAPAPAKKAASAAKKK
jgi:hypothetical protein